jgi:putative ATP-binding cassette transporter
MVSNIPQASEKVMNLMMEMNLSKHIDRLDCKNLHWSFILSGGEKQKIAIIGAVVKNPQLLILDEITTNLDEVSKSNVYKLLKKYLYDTTVIYTDHQPIIGVEDYILRICDHDLQVSATGLLSDNSY